MRVSCRVILLPGVALPDMPAPKSRPCAEARIVVHREGAAEILASGTTDAEGVFVVALAPGTYSVTASFLGSEPETKTVVISDANKMELTFDFTVAAP